MRTLYHVPIMHLEAGIVILNPEILALIEKKIGRTNLEYLRTEHQKFWGLVKTAVKENVSNFDGLIVYVESFLAGNREKVQKFFELLFNNNPTHPQYLFLQELLSKGAVLEGIEDMDLLKATVDFYRARGEEISVGRKVFDEPEVLELLQKRDRFIAQRINQTLPGEGLGLLFIGKHHRVIEELDKLEEDGKLISPMKVIYL